MNNKLQRNKKDNSSFNKIVMVVQIIKSSSEPQRSSGPVKSSM